MIKNTDEVKTVFKKSYRVDKSKNLMSRFRDLDRLVSWDGYEFIESVDDLEIKESVNDVFHQVMPEEEGRLDLISYKYYGTVLLWWVIAKVSLIEDPLTVKAGEVLRIPSKDYTFGLS